jgi:hypothetical protein
VTTTSDPGRARARDALARGDSAVDGHDRRRRELGEDAPHRVGPQAVAVAEPVRDEGGRIGAGAAQRRAQLRDRGYAVHVVVAEHDDAPAASRRGDEQVRGRLGALEQGAVVQSAGGGIQPRGRIRGGRDSAETQEPGHDPRHSGRAGERVVLRVLLWRSRCDAPDCHGLSVRRGPDR